MQDEESRDSRGSAGGGGRFAWLALGVAALGIGLYTWQGGRLEGPVAEPLPADSAAAVPVGAPAAQWNEVSRTEELVASLDVALGELAFAVRNLELPDRRTRRQFAPLGITVEDLSPSPPVLRERLASVGVSARVLEPAPLARDVIAPDLALWRPLLDEVAYFEHAKFQVKKGHFVPADPEEFEALVVFSARAVMRSGEIASFSASPVVRWRHLRGTNPKEATSWRILEWRSGAMDRLDVAQPLFREVLDEALADPADTAPARLSVHERWVSKQVLANLAREPFEPPYPLFAHTAVAKHPGLAVVDLDRDGFDDVYVTPRWGKNQFYRNRGDGSFEEIAAELGLDVEGFANAALFADFDNDGDSDVFIGQSIAPSLYLVNENGRFVDKTAELVTGRVPAMVSSLSAADVNGDGLLDLYASTYAVQLPLEEIERHLDPAVYREFVHRVNQVDRNSYTDVTGPPNVLLLNAGGGRFEALADAGALAVMRNTYQATWADFDDDGDPDVYLANDFARDNFVRNDGGGKFVDVTEEMGFTLPGFGMGITWGDYDRDGREDLYVANMYSKAGNRVTSGLDYLDPAFKQSAQGNYLYRNTPEGFALTSGSGPDDLHVYQAGWAWGTHFFDADNDGFLDLYALAGFHTAPKEVEKVGDT